MKMLQSLNWLVCSLWQQQTARQHLIRESKLYVIWTSPYLSQMVLSHSHGAGVLKGLQYRNLNRDAYIISGSFQPPGMSGLSFLLRFLSLVAITEQSESNHHRLGSPGRGDGSLHQPSQAEVIAN